MNKTLSWTLQFLSKLVMALLFVFFSLRLTPGDPVEMILGEQATFEQKESLRKELHLDKGIGQQLLLYFKQVVTLNFGQSLVQSKKVEELFATHVRPTLLVAVLTIIFSSLLGTVLGVWAAVKKGWIDQLLRIFQLGLLSIPIFSLAPLLIILFSIELGWLPVSEWGSWKHVVLPVLSLTLPLSSVLARVVRNAYLESENGPWVMVLRSKGLPNEAIIFRIVYSLLPTVLTIVSLQLSVLLGGTIITETIFDIPGLGLLLFNAINARDYPVVQGVIIYIGVIYLLVMAITDYLNKIFDPRLKSE